MPEEAKGQNLSQEYKKFIEVEAPEHLELRQNLYDQEPFSTLVRGFYESTGEKPDKIQTAISLIADEYIKDPKLEENELLRNAKLFLRPETTISWGFQVNILKMLQMYPYLSEYIELQRLDQRYARSGNPIHKQKRVQQTPSYASWLTQRQRAWLVGIEEIFPQDIGHPITSHPNVTGIKPGNRRYRILKAAEIIR